MFNWWKYCAYMRLCFFNMCHRQNDVEFVDLPTISLWAQLSTKHTYFPSSWQKNKCTGDTIKPSRNYYQLKIINKKKKCCIFGSNYIKQQRIYWISTVLPFISEKFNRN